jgi:hypothetical protein
MVTQEFSFTCSICGESVDITTCKTDELGKPVHNVCYAAKLARENELPLGSPSEPSRSPKAA